MLTRPRRQTNSKGVSLPRICSAAVCLLLALSAIRSGAAAAGSSANAPAENDKLIVYVSCDHDCAWTLDGGQHGTLKKGQEERLEMPVGKHRLEATSSDGQSWAETFELGQPSEEHIGITFGPAAPLAPGVTASTVSDVTLPKKAESPPPVLPEDTHGIPRFYAEARQMLVESVVYDKKEKAGKAWVPDSLLQQAPAIAKDLQDHFPRPASGLTAKDFQLLDNGNPQTINFLKEKDFVAVELTRQWVLTARVRGTWGRIPQDKLYVDFPAASYLLGYVPPSITPGECHKLDASVADHIVSINRDEYCGAQSIPALDSDTRENTPTGAKMRAFADSAAPGTIGISARAFTFWSSGVLSLAKDTAPNSATTVLSTEPSGPLTQPEALPPADFTYRIQVHDSHAPANVRVVSEFVLPDPNWDYDDCRKHHPAVHILGMIYTPAGEKVKEFGDTFFCYTLASELSKGLKFSKWWQSSAPTRFETQVELVPGNYEIRLVVSDGKKNLGRATVPVQVAPFDGHQLMTSDIVIGGVLRDASWILRDAARIAPAPVVPTPLVSKNVEFFPAVDSSIARYLPLPVYFEIYEPLLDTRATSVFFNLKITNLTSGSLVMNTGPMSAGNWTQPGSIVIPIGLKIATQKLLSGPYKLEVQATDSAGRQTGWRTANFVIP